MQKHFFSRALIFYIIISFVFLDFSYCQTVAPVSENTMPDKPAEKISLDFKSANLIDVLKLLSQQAGMSFVPTKEVMDTTVTLFMENVTVDEAINALMGANDLTFEKTAGNINVVRKSGEPEVKTETRIYNLNYVQLGQGLSSEGEGSAPAQSVLEVMQKVLTANGAVIADTRTNCLIVTDVPARFPIIEEIIARLDAPTPQVMIEAEIIETEAGLADKLGIEWGGGTGGVLSSTAPYWKYGLAPLHDNLLPNPAEGATFTNGTITADLFKAKLEALKENTATRYLARPKVMVLNNQTANISIMANQVINITTTTDAEGNMTQTVERADIGTLLKVTPLINNIDMITLKIEPEVSRAATNLKFTTTVDVHTRKATTIVLVKDGETVVIGGLITTEDDETKREVPGLSEIPLLGGLFKYKTKARKDRELLVFLTPHIVKTAETVAVPVESGAAKAEEPAAKAAALSEQKAEILKPEPKAQALQKTEAIKTGTEKEPAKQEFIREQGAQVNAVPIAAEPKPVQSIPAKQDAKKKEKVFLREQ